MIKNEESIYDLQPEELVSQYYQALYDGDLKKLKAFMIEKSYYMTLESLGVKRAFKDLMFKNDLENIEEDSVSLEKVEESLSAELLSHKSSVKVKIKKVESNGLNRKTVYYTEDGKVKNFYFSKEKDGWKINYYAGRKVD